MELHPVFKIFSDNRNPNSGLIELLKIYINFDPNRYTVNEWLSAYDELKEFIPVITDRNQFVIDGRCYSDFVKWSLWDSRNIMYATTPCSEYVCVCYDRLRSFALRQLGNL